MYLKHSIYKSIFSKLTNSNEEKIKFALDQDKLITDLKYDDLIYLDHYFELLFYL